MTPTTNEEIALRPGIRIAGRELKVGDKFDAPALLESKALNERTIATLRRVGQVGPLTPQNYANCMVHRPQGEIGAGFKVEDLIAAGIIDSAPTAPVGETVPVPEGAERIGSYMLFPVRSGKFTNWDVTTPAGVRMRERKFAKREGAVEFIGRLPALAEEGLQDGVQLQREPQHSDQQG